MPPPGLPHTITSHSFAFALQGWFSTTSTPEGLGLFDPRADLQQTFLPCSPFGHGNRLHGICGLTRPTTTSCTTHASLNSSKGNRPLAIQPSSTYAKLLLILLLTQQKKLSARLLLHPRLYVRPHPIPKPSTLCPTDPRFTSLPRRTIQENGAYYPNLSPSRPRFTPPLHTLTRVSSRSPQPRNYRIPLLIIYMRMEGRGGGYRTLASSARSAPPSLCRVLPASRSFSSSSSSPPLGPPLTLPWRLPPPVPPSRELPRSTSSYGSFSNVSPNVSSSPSLETHVTSYLSLRLWVILVTSSY